MKKRIARQVNAFGKVQYFAQVRKWFIWGTLYDYRNISNSKIEWHSGNLKRESGNGYKTSTEAYEIINDYKIQLKWFNGNFKVDYYYD